LNQRPIHGEVIVRGVLLDQRRLDHPLEKLLHQPVLCESLAIFGERGRVPHQRVRVQIAEPAVEQIPVDGLHQPPLGSDGIERLQQHGFQQRLRRNRRTSGLAVRRLEGAAHLPEHFVGLPLDRSQGMVSRQSLLGVGHKEHGVLQFWISAHEVLLFFGEWPPKTRLLTFVQIKVHSQFQRARFSAPC